MVSRLVISFTIIITANFSLLAQSSSYDSLVRSILELEVRVDEIELNLETSKEKFKKSIFIASLGYATTIAGGLMLGRENDQLGQVLLVSGGVIGSYGTYKMVDAFQYLSSRKKRQKKKY